MDNIIRYSLDRGLRQVSTLWSLVSEATAVIPARIYRLLCILPFIRLTELAKLAVQVRNHPLNKFDILAYL